MSLIQGAVPASTDRYEAGLLANYPATGEQRWFAIQTRSNFDLRVADQLVAKGIEQYLPSYQEVHQWKDRKRQITVPLFNGYLFVRLGNSSAARLKVLQTPGVVRILSRGVELEPVPDEEIEAVRRVVESRSALSIHPFLTEGTRVRLKRGPLKGIEGILIRIKNQARLVISVSILARSVAVETDTRDAERCQ
jgi:transcription antitermination factor NusG